LNRSNANEKDLKVKKVKKEAEKGCKKLGGG